MNVQLTVQQLKRIERTIHLVGAALLMAFVYSSLIRNDTWIALVRFAVVPALSVSGIVIWQAPRIVRALRSGS